jgi:Phage capsid family
VATVYEDFIPVSVSREVLQSVGETESAVMRLARTTRMPAGLESIPVVSVAPDAAFVNPAYGGRKPITSIEWTALKIVPEEIACTLAIPNGFLTDAGFPVWDSVREEVAKAIAREFDAAALYGTGAPASFPTGGLTAPAFATQSTPTADKVEAVDEAFADVEGAGLEVDGILGGPSLRGVMRSLMMGTENVATPPSSIWGVPIATTPVWQVGVGPNFRLALVGDWDYVRVGIREDIRFDLSTDGVLTDPAGVVLVNAFQDDSTLMRCYIRVGMVVGLPLGADGVGTEKPLALAQTTTALRRAAAASAEGGSEGGAAPRTHAELDALAAERGITFEEGATVADKQAALGY